MHQTSEPRAATAASVECVFLGPPGDGARLREHSAGTGVRITPAGSTEEARVLLALLSSRVLLARWDPADSESLATIHGVTNYGREAQWVAWLPMFDSGEWVECLERGAFDLVTGNDTSEKVAGVLRKAAAQYKRTRDESGRTRGLRRLFQFGDLLIFRKR